MSLHARRAFPFFISLALLSGCAADSATPTDSGPVTTGVDVAGEQQLDLVGLFEKAKALAETGSVEAKMQLAVLYNKGVGTPVNHERACELFREVAETGLAEAQAAIGICLMSDQTPDGKAAEHWLRLAAAQGVAGAHFNLALLYLRGTGIEANRTKGTRWARSAVALKHDEAQRLLEALDANARDHWYVLPAPEDLELYSGEKNGAEMQGKGTYTFEDGTRYEGDFDQDRFHGQGRVVWPNGREYRGAFENNDMMGRGKLAINGMMQNGEFVLGLLEGSGSMRWPDGRIYAGMFQHGVPHGNGQMLSPDGKSYNGEFARGVPHGPGKMTLPDGRTRTGVWHEGKLASQPPPEGATQPEADPPSAPESE